MTDATELILKDVRCFEGEQRGRLRPITLLVGENSTGKSTFLACFSVMHRMFAAFRYGVGELPDFNSEPFSMGSFRDIVRARRGRAGLIGDFEIGFTFTRRSGLPTEALVTFEEQGSQPIERSRRYRFGTAGFIEVRSSGKDKTILETPNGEAEINSPIASFWRLLDAMVWNDDPTQAENIGVSGEHALTDVRRLLNIDGGRRPSPGIALQSLLDTDLIPIAPLRAKPRRTYDPVREVDSPEGEHVPMLMMRLNHADKGRWDSLYDDLVRFGRESGLFADIKVRRHGKQISDPFQIQVKAQSSAHANLMDVGYGVSQSLPILVSLLSDNDSPRSGRYPSLGDRTFLLQQPEVHLHPRGQAALAELFARMASKGRNRFLIETHSDYILDRVRILVRRKVLLPDDVSIIFFEPRRNAVEMHNLSLDEFGNLENAPPSYRAFFLEESDRLLGFAD